MATVGSKLKSDLMIHHKDKSAVIHGVRHAEKFLGSYALTENVDEGLISKWMDLNPDHHAINNGELIVMGATKKEYKPVEEKKSKKK